MAGRWWIAFSETQRQLGREIRGAELDHEAFEMPLRVCELSRCRAACCHDGVMIEEDEKAVVSEVIEAKRGVLAGYGWREREYFGEGPGRGKSVTLAAAEVADDFPLHFPRTRCVFLDPEHRCVLQRLAMDEGRHPWWWKPVSCWLHPLILKPGAKGGRPLLTLAKPGEDPAAGPGYPGFSSCTPCGMAVEGGIPAREVLREELELLGKIAGRDLCGELEGGGGFLR